MKGRSLIIMIAVAAVLIIAAVFTSRDESRSRPENLMRSKVFPDLDVNAVHSIQLRSANGVTRIDRMGGANWVTPSRYGYPVRYIKVKEFLLELMNLTFGYQLPSDADTRAELKLIHPGSSSAVEDGDTATELTLSDADGNILGSMLIGAPHDRIASEGSGGFNFGGFPDGRYIAIDDQSVYVIGDTLDEVTTNVVRWLDTTILKVPQSEIVEFSRRGLDNATLLVSRSTVSNDFLVSGISTNEEIETGKLNNLTEALGFLAFSDLADPSLSDEKTGLDVPVVITVRTAGGKIATVSIGGTVDGSERRYLRASIRYEPASDAAVQPPVDSAVESRATDEPTDEIKSDREDIAMVVAELNDRISPWIYIVENYDADRLLTRREDLLKKEDPPDPEADSGADAKPDPIDPGSTDLQPDEQSAEESPTTE